jgi:bifunctional DNA-binding transcriptional regulator/antitoxin component of YhaV-PrlF toxin-antitoxin module
MNEFRVKIGEDGRILIPVFCRRYLKLSPGEEIIIKLDKDELHLFSLKRSLKNAQKIVKAYAKNHNLVKKLQQLRQEDSSGE